MVVEKDSERGLKTYVNYARGDEVPAALYGYDWWRGRRLSERKSKWDPYGRFDFYAPLPRLGSDEAWFTRPGAEESHGPGRV
jgi:hypothetical protein